MEKTKASSAGRLPSDFMKEFLDLLLSRQIVTLSTIRGCEDSEIRDIEGWFGYPLPIVYRDFLLMFGARAGTFMEGTDFLCKDLLDIRDSFYDLAKEHKFVEEVPASWFVFSAHQGYIFHFFDVNEDRVDPPVYGYEEGEEIVQKVYDRFSEFLTDGLGSQPKKIG